MHCAPNALAISPWPMSRADLGGQRPREGETLGVLGCLPDPPAGWSHADPMVTCWMLHLRGSLPISASFPNFRPSSYGPPETVASACTLPWDQLLGNPNKRIKRLPLALRIFCPPDISPLSPMESVSVFLNLLII